MGRERSSRSDYKPADTSRGREYTGRGVRTVGCSRYAGKRLGVELTQDYAAVKTVLTHPAIWEDIGGEGDPADWEVPGGALYLLGCVDGVPMGVFVLHGDAGSMECHVQVVPEYREEFAAEFGRRVVEASKMFTRRLTAEIPKRFPAVHAFALTNGFEVTGEDSATRWYVRELTDGIH